MTNLEKIQLSIREIEKKLNTLLRYKGPPEIPPPFIGKQPPEVETLLTKRTALVKKAGRA